MKLKRIEHPILEPIPENSWESRAVLNPATIRDGDEVHMLYRAVQGENLSTIGYAKLDRNNKIVERKNHPVIRRTEPFERQGCEDPRIAKLNGVYYVFYSGFDGNEVRVCAASTEDFVNYKKYGVIIPDVWNKDAMIFPEPVNGKIIFIHRIEPNIQFAYFDNIEQLLFPDKNHWQKYLSRLEEFTVLRPKFDWESKKIGGGPPPIKTAKGWLLIYHGVDDNLVYRAGAALLDLDNPQKVIARSPVPILEPEREYELTGDVPNVVFPEGTAVFDDTLYVYYGGADKVIGLATINLPEFIDELTTYKA